MIRVRDYGAAGAPVIVLHGGPGAPGYMAPVARRLAASFRVLEPFQRPSGEKPLTVARHVADLHEVIETRCAGERPALVGHSWGAMLALAYAAAYPDRTNPIALIGCGTFDPVARARLQATLEGRTNDDLRRQIEQLDVRFPDPNRRLDEIGKLILPLYSYDLITTEQESEPCDARAQEESWQDMLRLQEVDVYPAAFAAIKAPVLMIHGADDPHPGAMIRAGLAPLLPQLEYRELDRCGHYPWLERAARNEFFSILRAWLIAHLAERGGRQL